MPRIDTHLHLWDTTRFDYPWRRSGSFSGLSDTYLLDDATAETAGDETSFVVVQAEVDHANDPVEETAWIQEMADTHPSGDRIAGFVAYADLSRPDVGTVLKRHARHPVFVGIRQELWWEKPSPRPDILEEDMLESTAWRRGFSSLAAVNATFDLTCWHSQLRPFATFLADHPETTVVIDHLGSPKLGDDTANEIWLDGVNALAALPNTFMKISGLSQADPRWSIDSIGPVVDTILRAFGPERCMLGSNFPVEKPTSSYEQLWAAYQVLFSGLSPDERDNLHFRTAAMAYRLEV